MVNYEQFCLHILMFECIWYTYITEQHYNMPYTYRAYMSRYTYHRGLVALLICNVIIQYHRLYRLSRNTWTLLPTFDYIIHRYRHICICVFGYIKSAGLGGWLHIALTYDEVVNIAMLFFFFIIWKLWCIYSCTWMPECIWYTQWWGCTYSIRNRWIE